MLFPDAIADEDCSRGWCFVPTQIPDGQTRDAILVDVEVPNTPTRHVCEVNRATPISEQYRTL